MLSVSVLTFDMLYLFAQNILEVLGAGDLIRSKSPPSEGKRSCGTVYFPSVRHFLTFKLKLETVDHCGIAVQLLSIH